MAVIKNRERKGQLLERLFRKNLNGFDKVYMGMSRKMSHFKDDSRVMGFNDK